MMSYSLNISGGRNVKKNLFFIFILPLLILVLNSSICNKDSNPVESNCGDKHSRTINSSGTKNVDQITVNAESQIATATWQIHSSGVCTYEHLSLDIEVEIKAAYANTFTVQSSVFLNPLYIPQVPLSKSTNWDTGNAFYRGTGNVGLKQVFGEGPGEFTYYLELSFPSKGSANQDTEFIDQAVKNVTILCSFYFHK